MKSDKMNLPDNTPLTKIQNTTPPTITQQIHNVHRNIQSLCSTLTRESIINTYNIGILNNKLHERAAIEHAIQQTTSRNEQFDILRNEIENTPLLKIEGLLPNNNTLFIKCESESSLGKSHYMRVYYALIKHYEELGIIKPGDTLYDFTSGSSGVSLASIATLLGYCCEIGIPAGGEKAREHAILEWIPKEHLHFSDASKYVAGALEFNKQFLKERSDVFFLNHAMSVNEQKQLTVNSISTDACGNAMAEVMRDMAQTSLTKMIVVSGNGTTQYGYSKKMKSLLPDIEITGLEAFQSGFVFDKLYPDLYQSIYGIDTDDRKKFSRHRLPGTSFPGKTVYPAINESLSFLRNEVLVWDTQAQEEYEQIFHKSVPKDAIFFDRDIPKELLSWGRTTAASFKVASTLAEHTYNENILMVAYDHKERYDQ